jgi:hypothetical protein
MKPFKNPNSLWNPFGKPNLINGRNRLSKVHGPPPPLPAFKDSTSFRQIL